MGASEAIRASAKAGLNTDICVSYTSPPETTVTLYCSYTFSRLSPVAADISVSRLTISGRFSLSSLHETQRTSLRETRETVRLGALDALLNALWRVYNQQIATLQPMMLMLLYCDWEDLLIFLVPSASDMMRLPSNTSA